MDLKKISNRDLWEEWKESLETAALDDSNSYAKRREAQCLNEIVRRMQEASRMPLVRQEAQA